jgi:hypothetical protein
LKLSVVDRQKLRRVCKLTFYLPTIYNWLMPPNIWKLT